MYGGRVGVRLDVRVSVSVVVRVRVRSHGEGGGGVKGWPGRRVGRWVGAPVFGGGNAGRIAGLREEGRGRGRQTPRF